MSIVALVVVLAQWHQAPACGAKVPAPGAAADFVEAFTTSDGIALGVEEVVTNLEIPWSMAFAPDGRLFITERPGRVRIVQDGALLPAPALVLDDVRATGEGGLLGLALHPAFESNRFVYLLYTTVVAGMPVNRLARYREVNNTLADRAVLLERMAAANIHNGGRIRFGPDGRLYLSMGDANAPVLAQSLASLNGKVLRLDEAGQAAPGGPFSSEVWTWGHRNPQGFDWHPDTADLWATEHGPTGNDEVNHLRPGVNYGWPVIVGGQTMAGMETPMAFYDPSIAPSGGSFYRGSRMPGLRANFFFGTLRGQHLHRIVFDTADPGRIVATERLLEGRFGRIRDVVSGPDGAIYFCTNNRDGRGSPREGDDRVLRIVPARPDP